MIARQVLADVLRELDDNQLGQVAEFADFLRWRRESAQWREFGREQFSRVYGDNEPEYTKADLKDGRSA